MPEEQPWFKDEDELEASDSEPKPDETNEKETQDSSTEKPNEEATGADQDKNTDEEELPFHKHPRFKAITSENRELKASLDELRQTVEQFTATQKELPKGDTQVPDWFVTAFGDNPEAYQALQQFESSREEQLKQSIIEQIAAEKTQKKAEDNSIKEFIDNEIATLKDEGNVFDVNELKKVVLENKLFDADGRLNFRAGLAIVKATKPDTTQAKKEVANLTNSAGGGTVQKTDYTTPKDLRKATSALDFLKNL